MAAVAFTGCAKSEAPACSVSSDCGEDQICIDAVCEDVTDISCSFDSPCPSGFTCEAGVCIADDEGGDLGDNETGDDEGDDEPSGDDEIGDNETGDDEGDDEEVIDPSSPRVESVFPLDGATGVDADVTIRVKFDRPIAYQFGRLNSNGIHLRSPDGERLAANLEYLVDEREVLLTPNEPLWPGTTFTLHVTEYILDETESFALSPTFSSSFTTDFTISEDAEVLAELFAPVIYQETRMSNVSGLRSDIPTRVDFDGNMDADDNKANGLQASTNLPAHVYYSVVSTETHHFIQYFLYYVARRYGHAGGATFNEHDFTGMVVVVDRETLEVDLIEGVHNSQSSAQTRALTYRPSGSSATGRGSNNENKILDIERSDLEGETHFPLYVPSGDHAACFWNRRTDNLFFPDSCPGNPGEFVGGLGIILRHGTQAQTYLDAVDSDTAGVVEMTYTLLPFVEPFWTMRNDSGCGLFDAQGFTYSPWSPEGYTPMVGAGEDAFYLPRRLCSQETESYGNLPYRWFSNISTGGEWFFDPAMTLNDRINFGDDFSRSYCDHFYFNVDRSGEEACGGSGD